MKSIYLGHFIQDGELLDEMFTKATIIFDTNIYLDLFRVSEKTQEKIWEILNGTRERVWCPYQVSREYINNFHSVISGQISNCKQFITDLQKLKKEYFASERHPFLSDELTLKISTLTDECIKHLNNHQETVRKLITNNATHEKIGEYLNGKVGAIPTADFIDSCKQEADRRFDLKVPPGYADRRKKSDLRVIGDYILWKQMIDFSLTSKNDLIFITNDEKEDWFLQVDGLKIGPRPELIDEFYRLTGKHIYVYSFFGYLNQYTKRQADSVDEGTLKEIELLPSKDERNQFDASEFTQTINVSACNSSNVLPDDCVQSSISNENSTY